ncbi:MAG TPA: GntR family transcriptional regulator [Verrucomicrobiae bacterium]|jgi:GntR family transcriptional regulator
MFFQIDFNAATALYRQLVDQVRFAAASGTLKPHDPLPAIRPLARQLHLNRNTVAKAFTELESLGVIKTILGKGSFVEPVNTPFLPKIRHKLLVAKIDAALVAAHQLQVDAPSFAALVAERTKYFAQKIKDERIPQEPEEAPSLNETLENETNIAKLPQKRSSSTKPRTPGAPAPQSSSPIPPQTTSPTDSENWSPSMD